MKKILTFLLMSIWVLSFGQNRVVVHADQAKEKISRNIYGHFAEHLGHCIYKGFYVGDGSTIPNTEGVRNDIIDALKKLKVPVLRWPGGCFADTYHWKNGIGPKNQRPSMVNKWWGGVTEDNSFGTHEFLNLCERLGAAPYLAGNVGSGTVQELADWVQYVNSSQSNPMSSLRVQNGRKDPWKVKYWGVGNEAWGCGGNMTPEFYANIYRQYATFMSDWSNSDNLTRVASGANSSDYHWTEVMMRDIPPGMLEGVALHHYSVIDWDKKGSATNFTESQYFNTIKQALRMEELVKQHSAIMDKYDPDRKVALIVDEWGGWYDGEPGSNPSFLFQQNTLRDAVLAGVTLNIFNNHCERVKMANLAQTVNVLQAVILTDSTRILLTPTYHVMEMYNVHQDATLIPVTVTSADYTVSGEKLPAISASCSKDEKGRIHLSLVNIDEGHPQEIVFDARALRVESSSGRILTSSKVQDHNTFEKPETVKPKVFEDYTTTNGILKIKMPPFSVVVLELKL